MPGRGQPWKGVGKGRKDRIGTDEVIDDSLQSEDIKDGTIAEVDLDSALQAKVNSGGEANTNSNEGTGEGTLSKTKSGVNLPLKTLKQGTNITLTNNADDITIDATGGGGGYDTIQEEGTPVAQESAIDFQGAGVTATAGTGKTIVTIPGGGGGGSGVVEKIHETTLTVATEPIDITLSPAVDLADYTEFWIIVNGATVATTDIHMAVNNLVSYEYGTFWNRLKNNGTNDSYTNFGSERWDFTRSGAGTRNLLDGNFDFKIELQGGLPVDGKLNGTLHGVYRSEDTNGAPSIIDGGVELVDVGAQTQLTHIKLFTFTGNFKIGTSVSVYGVKKTP